MGSNNTMAGITGSYDNLNEPIPLSNKLPTILGVTISFHAFAWICAIFRMWTRFKVIKAPGWDDLFVVLSLLATCFGATVICISGAHYGLGKHFIELGSNQAMQNYLEVFYLGNAAYVLSTALIKIALLLQYLRIFQRGEFLRRFSIAMLIIVALWGFAFNILAWFPCSPIDAFWSMDPDANCWAFGSQTPEITVVTFELHSAFNMLLDLIILYIPIHMYFKSDVAGNTKRALLGLLLLGAVVNFASIYRMVTIVQHNAATTPTFDPSWYGCVSILLSAVEVDLAMVCACVPVFWPVLQSAAFEIFVTKEVKITSESRMTSSDEEEGIELHSAGAIPAGAPMGYNVGNYAPPVAPPQDRHGVGHHLHKERSGDGSDPSSFFDDKDEAEDPSHWRRTMTGPHVSVSANRDRPLQR